ncbi:mCG2372 [Mus musculus]|nr:mCG2372 [Mus musculus]
MLEEFRASQCCCCCSALCQIGMPVNCLFLWLSSVTAVTGAISRGETNFFLKFT